jgi:hypothetical protein
MKETFIKCAVAVSMVFGAGCGTMFRSGVKQEFQVSVYPATALDVSVISSGAMMPFTGDTSPLASLFWTPVRALPGLAWVNSLASVNYAA